MKRPGPPAKGRKPYTGTKPPKGQERDPGAARRKKQGSTGYPRAPDVAAARRAEATEVWPAPKPVRAGKLARPARQGLDTVPKPVPPERGRAAAIEAGKQRRPDAGQERRPQAGKPPRPERAPKPHAAPAERRRPAAAPSPPRETMRVVDDSHAARPAPKPSRSQRRGETGGTPPRPLPTLEQLAIFFRGARAKVNRNEIARHFGLVAEQRPALKALLAAMDAPRSRPAALPDMLPVEVTAITADGDVLARPLSWEGAAPTIHMQPETPALTPGDRVLARLRPTAEGYDGRTFKRIGREIATPDRILGIVSEGRIVPTDRRQKGQWSVSGEAREGDIVLAEPLPDRPGRHFGPRPAVVTKVLGRLGEAKSVSLICIHAHGIPTDFPPEAVEQAEHARATPLAQRDDLRATPLITIDGEDARDFDDAVFAEPDGDGWRVLVAIADVAHYVPPASALDREASLRGNSVYFPDRVVPMLPEALSNGWCSLRPDEDRGCLFVDMRFDAQGDKLSHRFGRGLMRSVARLTYEAAQAARDEGREPAGLAAGHMAQLYGAFAALLSARGRRGTLELDLPERRVVLSPEGQVTGVAPRPRLDSHKLIEEFMIAANVCAAEELERLSQPCMYRIHDRPSDQKLEGLRQFLQQFGMSMPPGNQLHPRNFSHVLEMVKGAPHERLVNETVLRSQSQAAYSPDNIGHFGLALARYAHFTSPIRRYSDLMVHRALIRGLKLGRDGITEAEAGRMPEIADAITATERRAAAAERDAVDRYMAAFMADRVGEVFSARISGVTRFGLFVAVEETGAQGIVPFSALPDDRWEEDAGRQSLVGRRTGQRFTLGDAVEVALRDANAMTGSLQFQLRQGPAKRPAGRGTRRK